MCLAFFLRVVLDRSDLGWAEFTFGVNIALDEPFDTRVMSEVKITILGTNQQKCCAAQLVN